MAYNKDGSPLYAGYTCRRVSGKPVAFFALTRPIRRHDPATGRSAVVRHDDYNARELSELIAEVRRDGHDTSMLMNALANLQRLASTRHAAPSAGPR